MWARRRIREKNSHVMALDTFKIADEVATNPELRIRMMGIALLGVFLKATPFARRHDMSFEKLMEGVEKAVRSYWGKRGEQVVQDNLTCIRRGYQEVVEVPRELIMDAPDFSRRSFIFSRSLCPSPGCGWAHASEQTMTGRAIKLSRPAPRRFFMSMAP